jgi:hypothetical protein
LQLNFLHRFAGKLVVLAANIHALSLCECLKTSTNPKLAYTQKKSLFLVDRWNIIEEVGAYQKHMGACCTYLC